MHMRRLEEAQLVLAEVDHLAVPVALDAATVVPSAEVQQRAGFAAIRSGGSAKALLNLTVDKVNRCVSQGRAALGGGQRGV